MATKYSKSQMREILAFEENQFRKLMERVGSEEDELFHRSVYRLLLKIYEMQLDGKYLTKMQACRLISAKHQNVCQRYVEEARERGFVHFRRDEKDKRRIFIVPRQQLIQYVENELERAADEVRELVSIAKLSALPPI